MLDIKMIDITIIRGILIGIWISGSFLFRGEDFSLYAIKRMRIPVITPEIKPPITRMKVNVVL